MICLGIESTAHTFGIGIVKDNKILSNEKSMYVPKKGSGIIPRDAAQHHSEVSLDILKKSLDNAKLKIDDINIIAFSRGPGLPQCLRIGAVFARSLAMKYKKPLVGVNHCVAHIEIGKMSTSCIDPVVLYLSGGNTQVIALADGEAYEVLPSDKPAQQPIATVTITPSTSTSGNETQVPIDQPSQAATEAPMNQPSGLCGMGLLPLVIIPMIVLRAHKQKRLPKI